MTTKNQQPTDNPQPGTVTDVTRPAGQSPADPTSRPIIIANRPQVQDPMMVVPTDPGQPADPSAGLVSNQVVSHASFKSSHQPVAALRPPTRASDKSPVNEPVDQLSHRTIRPVSDQPAERVTNIRDIGSASSEADKTNDVNEGTNIADQLQDKSFFLPINAAGQRRSHQVLIGGVGIIILLAAAWLDIAMDAGLVRLAGVHSITHFFQSR